MAARALDVDEAAVLAGSLGMLPSASLGERFTEHGTLPPGVTLEQFKTCPGGCFAGAKVDSEFTSALETGVIEPMRRVQKLISAHPQITRLYTTMSASEMTVCTLMARSMPQFCFSVPRMARKKFR